MRNHDNLHSKPISLKKIDPHQFTYIYTSIALFLENIIIIDDKKDKKSIQFREYKAKNLSQCEFVQIIQIEE